MKLKSPPGCAPGQGTGRAGGRKLLRWTWPVAPNSVSRNATLYDSTRLYQYRRHTAEGPACWDKRRLRTRLLASSTAKSPRAVRLASATAAAAAGRCRWPPLRRGRHCAASDRCRPDSFPNLARTGPTRRMAAVLPRSSKGKQQPSLRRTIDDTASCRSKAPKKTKQTSSAHSMSGKSRAELAVRGSHVRRQLKSELACCLLAVSSIAFAPPTHTPSKAHNPTSSPSYWTRPPRPACPCPAPCSLGLAWPTRCCARCPPSGATTSSASFLT